MDDTELRRTPDDADPGSTPTRRCLAVLNSSCVTVRAVAAAARLLQSPFVGDKPGLVKFIVDNTRAVEKDLAEFRTYLDDEPDGRERGGDSVAAAASAPRRTR